MEGCSPFSVVLSLFSLISFTLDLSLWWLNLWWLQLHRNLLSPLDQVPHLFLVTGSSKMLCTQLMLKNIYWLHELRIIQASLSVLKLSIY